MNMISSMWGLPRSFFPAWPTTSDLLRRKVFGVECRQIQVIQTSPSLFLLSKRSFSYQEVVLQKLGLPQKYGLVWQGLETFSQFHLMALFQLHLLKLYQQPRMRWRSLVHWRIAFIGKPFKLQEEVTRKLQIGGGAFYSHNSSQICSIRRGKIEVARVQ